jgi:hypothetical protein
MTVHIVFLVSWGGVRLSPLGTSATNWPIVPAPDDRWWVWSIRWNENWQGKPMYSEKTCPSATLSTANPTWPEMGSNPDRRGGNPAANGLSYGAAIVHVSVISVNYLLQSEYMATGLTNTTALNCKTGQRWKSSGHIFFMYLWFPSNYHLTSYSMGTGDFFPGGKAAGAWNRPLTSS